MMLNVVFAKDWYLQFGLSRYQMNPHSNTRLIVHINSHTQTRTDVYIQSEYSSGTTSNYQVFNFYK